MKMKKNIYILLYYCLVGVTHLALISIDSPLLFQHQILKMSVELMHLMNMSKRNINEACLFIAGVMNTCGAFSGEFLSSSEKC